MTTDTADRGEPVEHERRTVHFYDYDAPDERRRGPHLAHVLRFHESGAADLEVRETFRDVLYCLAVPARTEGASRYWIWPPRI